MKGFILSIPESGNTILVMNGEMRAYGQLIHDGMQRAGFIGKTVAPKLGISETQVSDWVNGHKKTAPSPELVDAIWRVLGISKREQLAALGYLDPDEAEPGVAYTIQEDDPRVAVLRIMDGMTPAQVAGVARAVKAIDDMVRAGGGRVDLRDVSAG